MTTDVPTLPNLAALAAHLRDGLAKQLVEGLNDVESREQTATRLSERLAVRVVAIEQEQQGASPEVA